MSEGQFEKVASKPSAVPDCSDEHLMDNLGACLLDTPRLALKSYAGMFENISAMYENIVHPNPMKSLAENAFETALAGATLAFNNPFIKPGEANK